VTDLVSFSGTSDISGFLPDYFAAEFWDDPEPNWRHSPVFNAKGVTTPTLIRHGEADARVPLSQGRELYHALKRRGTPVELVVYPRQGYGPDEPRLVLDLGRRVNDWLDRLILDRQ
jgi:dipeptidyl aminopeptidase/acylaminoacyl peptidase